MNNNVSDLPELVIFDWDGTLMDSTAKIVTCFQKAAEDIKLTVPESESVRQIIGLSLDHAFEILFPGISSEQKVVLFKNYRIHFIEKDDTPMPLFDGAVECLETLRENNIKLAVATGKARIGLQRVMAISNLEHYFEDSICADEAMGKPHPEMLQVLLQRFNLQAEQAIMIGDTEHDLEMAHNANMRKIAVSHGAHSIEQLEKWEPLAMLHHLSELPAALSLK